MSVESPTFVFEDDRAYAIREGKVIAAADSVEELEEQLENSDEESQDEAPKKKHGTHIVTPNGVKGKIVSRVEGLWGDEVTVRLENGNIAHYHVLADTEFVDEDEEDEKDKKNPIDNLKKRLEKDTEHDSKSLLARREELKQIRQEASSLIQKGASLDDSEKLDRIALLAADELGQVDETLETLAVENERAFQPPAPYEVGAQRVEQESLGHGDSAWLDDAVNDIIADAEDQDYNRLLSEGPELFVSDLEDATLADQGVTQSVAASFIQPKVAAADDSLSEKFSKVFLERVEQARREELKNRKRTAKKEAATQKEAHDDAPDESIFL